MKNDDQFPTELCQGTVLERGWRIERKLGQGKMGRVYEAFHIRLQRVRALKQTFYYEDWFEREARLLSRLNHRSIPKVDDYFEERGSYFFPMELIPGPSLQEKLQISGALPPDLVLNWATQLLDALHYLHTQPKPIIHRDIKPDNIRLDDDKVFLVDFDIAKDLTEGTIVQAHTPDYAPPEQFPPSGHTDQRSDLYSLGATLYHLVSGKLADNAAKRADALSNGYPDPLRPVNEMKAEVPRTLAAVIHKAMAFRKEDRYESARDMLEALSVDALQQRLPYDITLSRDERQMFINTLNEILPLFDMRLREQRRIRGTLWSNCWGYESKPHRESYH